MKSGNLRSRLRVLLPLLVVGLIAAACDEAAGTPPVLLLDVLTPGVTKAQPAPVGMDRIAVDIGAAGLSVEVAATPDERQTGLSGRRALGPDEGMLFYFSSGKATSLWMRGMLFNLDFIWIGASCTVVDIHTEVPAPTRPDDALPVFRPAQEAASVIEVAGGAVRSQGIKLGDEVRYGRSPQGTSYGCEG